MKISKYLVPLFALLVSLTSVNSASAGLSTVQTVFSAAGNISSGQTSGQVDSSGQAGQLETGDIFRFIQSITQVESTGSGGTYTGQGTISAGSNWVGIVWAGTYDGSLNVVNQETGGANLFSDLFTTGTYFNANAAGYILSSTSVSNPFVSQTDFTTLASTGGFDVVGRLDLVGGAATGVTAPGLDVIEYTAAFDIADGETGLSTLFGSTGNGQIRIVSDFTPASVFNVYDNYSDSDLTHQLAVASEALVFVNVVPEPNSFLVLAGFGVFGLGYRRREKKA